MNVILILHNIFTSKTVEISVSDGPKMKKRNFTVKRWKYKWTENQSFIRLIHQMTVSIAGVLPGIDKLINNCWRKRIRTAQFVWCAVYTEFSLPHMFLLCNSQISWIQRKSVILYQFHLLHFSKSFRGDEKKVGMGLQGIKGWSTRGGHKNTNACTMNSNLTQQFFMLILPLWSSQCPFFVKTFREVIIHLCSCSF